MSAPLLSRLSVLVASPWDCVEQRPQRPLWVNILIVIFTLLISWMHLLRNPSGRVFPSNNNSDLELDQPILIDDLKRWRTKKRKLQRVERYWQCYNFFMSVLVWGGLIASIVGLTSIGKGTEVVEFRCRSWTTVATEIGYLKLGVGNSIDTTFLVIGSLASCPEGIIPEKMIGMCELMYMSTTAASLFLQTHIWFFTFSDMISTNLYRILSAMFPLFGGILCVLCVFCILVRSRCEVLRSQLETFQNIIPILLIFMLGLGSMVQGVIAYGLCPSSFFCQKDHPLGQPDWPVMTSESVTNGEVVWDIVNTNSTMLIAREKFNSIAANTFVIVSWKDLMLNASKWPSTSDLELGKTHGSILIMGSMLLFLPILLLFVSGIRFPLCPCGDSLTSLALKIMFFLTGKPKWLWMCYSILAYAMALYGILLSGVWGLTTTQGDCLGAWNINSISTSSTMWWNIGTNRWIW